ncbi:MAG: putative toxin-antitoxin system toxin component, PIN family [Caldilineaceae bacterium]|nr:putative toxin-antitoxin system toxin component, PIN family [Caldilineaceae bacterium]HRJ43208.1 putative toxin-antitoxin system toxin component, PIN family [Caldilineaceae bacterium]
MATRVVFDTNILISALLSLNGAPFRCIALARTGLVQSVTCPQILDEFAEKLRSKFAFAEDRVLLAVGEIRNCSEVVAAPDILRVVADDPDDDVVIECAVIGEASVIVSGDKHLRSLARYQTIQILTAVDFLSLENG